MKARGGRFGKYGELKRKTKLRRARLSHLQHSQPFLSADQRKSGSAGSRRRKSER